MAILGRGPIRVKPVVWVFEFSSRPGKPSASFESLSLMGEWLNSNPVPLGEVTTLTRNGEPVFHGVWTEVLRTPPTR